MSEPPTFPTLTAAQALLVDQVTSEHFGIPSAWLMEAVGWQVARACRNRPSPARGPRRACSEGVGRGGVGEGVKDSSLTYVVCGRGNNGGDGLAAARHLHRWGLLAGVACLDLEGLKGAALEEAKALCALGVTPDDHPRFGDAELILDALLGTGFKGAPRDEVAEWIEVVNSSNCRVASVDLPSGLDADTGVAPGACIQAQSTLTLGLPKPGLLTPEGAARAGEIWVVDIGIPKEVYAFLGISVPEGLFSMADRVLFNAKKG